MKTQLVLIVLLSLVFLISCYNDSDTNQIATSTNEEIIKSLIDIHDRAEIDRITRGVNHLSNLWFTDDGNAEDFEKFCHKQFVPSGDKLDQLFDIVEDQLEVIYGHTREIGIQLDLPVVTHQRPITEIDRLFTKSKPSTDFYQSKLAFAIALNFPYFTPEEKEEFGTDWNRKEWAMVRLGDRFSYRADPSIKVDRLPLPVDLVDYTKLYIISMDHILSSDMTIIFPEGTRLNCHNGLRDEIKGLYTRKDPLSRQRIIYQIVMHVLDQTIPTCMIGETNYYWKPDSNEVFIREGGKFVKTSFEAETDRRYRFLHNRFNSRIREDIRFPKGSTHLSRTFENRQLSEQRVTELLESIVGSEERYEVAKILEKRLGRELEPFDIWYPGFQSQSNYDMDELDALLKQKYPSPLAFQEDIPNILTRIGFEPNVSDFLGNHVIVDPIPSGGHANGAQMKGEKAHLRTRFEPYGLNYKGYRIGMHEIGHTIEQNVSLYLTDYYSLKGIPSAPFTECMADLIAYRDVLGLGVSEEYSKKERELNALASFMYVWEMGAEGLHEIRVWNWFYDHPDAGVEELRKATIDIAKDVWNEYFADLFGEKDNPILSIYNHFLGGSLYLHAYPLGNIILMQVEEYMIDKDFAKEMVRMCTIGKLTPDLWMMEATGEKVSSEPMLRAVRRALENY